jgi:PAS domain S-box-containing protein
MRAGPSRGIGRAGGAWNAALPGGWLWILALLLLLVHAPPSGAAHEPQAPGARVLRVGGDHDFPPYEMLGPDGQPQGFDVELFRAVAQVMELEVVFELDSWDRVRERLEAGELDAVVGMHYSPARDEVLDFSTPYALAHYAIFVQAGSAGIDGAADLAGRAVVLQRGTIVHDMAPELGIADTLTTVPTAADALRSLAAGEQDAALLFRFQGLYLLEKLGLDNVEMVGQPLAPQEYCFAVGEGDRQLLDALNEGLALVKATGRYREIHQAWLGVLEPHRWTLRRTVRVAAWVLLPSLFIVLLALAQAAMLRRQVALRTRQLEAELAERRRAEEALAQEHERLAVTLRSIADAVITTDREGRVEQMNQVAEELLGADLEQVRGQPLDRVLLLSRPDGARLDRGLVTRVLGAGGRTVVEHTLRLEAGGRALVSLGAAPIRRGEALLGVVVALRDITARRRMEEELARSEKLESVGLLAGGIAHDFNNILTGVLGHVSLAMQRLDERDPRLTHLRKAEAATQRAQGLTQQLLTFSTGGAPVRRVLRLAPLLEEAVEFALAGGVVRPMIELEEDLWPLDADAGQLAQVLHNLLINAVQAMPGGGQVRIKAENLRLPAGHDSGLSEGPYLCIRIEDDGPGIPPELAQNVFEPFFTTKDRGSGLGLATAYSISRQHGGWLGLEPEGSGGACFLWLLPAVPGAEASHVDPVLEPQPGVGRVLVMDDEEVVREVLEAMLTTLGYAVSLATHGEAAVDLYREAMEQGRQFSTVIMDLTVPGGMGGIKAMEAILALDPAARGIVSSGFSDDPVMADPRAYGFCAVVGKPFRLAELSAALVQAAGGGEL